MTSPHAKGEFVSEADYVDLEGGSIGLEEWGRLRDDERYWRVAQTVITCARGNETAILTCWHGIVGYPLITTAIFMGGWADEVRQYGTLSEALEGHQDVVKHRLGNEQNHGPATTTEGVDSRWYDFVNAARKDA